MVKNSDFFIEYFWNKKYIVETYTMRRIRWIKNF